MVLAGPQVDVTAFGTTFSQGWSWTTGLLQGPQLGLRLAGLPLGAWIGVSSTGSLDFP